MKGELLERVLIEKVNRPAQISQYILALARWIMIDRIRFIKFAVIIFGSIWLSFFTFKIIGSGPVKIERAEKVEPDNEIVKNVSKIAIIPEEIPSIVTVINLKKLVNNGFFKGADEGDKVLIFKNSNKAILYDIESDKILNFGSIEDTKINFE